jgi:hypothetical protein
MKYIFTYLLTFGASVAWAQPKFSPSFMAGIATNIIDRGSDPDYSAPSLNPRLAVGLGSHWAVGAGSFLSLQRVSGYDNLTTHMTGGFVQWSPIVKKRLRTAAEVGYYRGNTFRSTEFPASGPEEKDGQGWFNLRLATEIKVYGPLYADLAFNFLKTRESDWDNMPTLGLLVRL